MEITIKDNIYTIKYTLRSLFIFEQITGKAFALKTITDEYIFIYCLILANVPDIQLSFEDFISECDSDPKLVSKMQKFIAVEMNKQALFMSEASEGDSKKKN